MKTSNKITSSRKKSRKSAPTIQGPTPTTHRCLIINEILRHIFSFVKHSGKYSPKDTIVLRTGSRLGKRMLADLARTCRLFRDPALDELWVCLETLTPLCKVFPKDRTCLFANKAAWLVFRRYANRVKSLCGPCLVADPHVSQCFNTLRNMCFLKFHLPLLHNLTQLVWFQLPPDDTNEFNNSFLFESFVAGPKLTTIVLHFRTFSESLRDEYLHLPERCPNVTSFSTFFEVAERMDAAADEIGAMVRKMPNLQFLQTCALSQSAMESLISRKRIKTMCIEVYADSPIPDQLQILPDSLTEFSLRGYDVRMCTEYLLAISGGPPKFQLIFSHLHSSHPDIQKLFDLLPLRLDKCSLRLLSIERSGEYFTKPLQRPPMFLTESLLSPLLEFSALWELDLDEWSASSLNDDTYAQLANKLKNLRSLKLGTKLDVPARSQEPLMTTVGAVIEVLKGCRHLEILHIPFDGTSPPPERPTRSLPNLDLVDGWGVANERITQLHVGHSPVRKANVDSLVFCLKSVMPHLEKIEYKSDPNSSKCWKMIQFALKTI